jgi:hypothetical protein
LTATNLTESGFSCSVTPTLMIDTSSAGQQPNILLANDSTSIGVSIKKANTWYPITLGYLDNGVNAKDPVLYLATSPTGTVSFEYLSAGKNANDQITATACSAESTPQPVYDFSEYLDTDQTTLVNIHQSQVSDDAFIDTGFSEANIETFFVNNSAYLARFYLDITNPRNGGWCDPAATATTETFVEWLPDLLSVYVKYCFDMPDVRRFGHTGLATDLQ